MRVHHLGTGLLVVALGSMLAGCVGPEESSVDIEGPDVAGQTAGETVGSHNGLDDDYFRAVMLPLAFAMSRPILEPGTNKDVNYITAQQMLQTTAGRTTFEYVVHCAVPAGLEIGAAGHSYKGGGLLVNTDGWLHDPLKPEQRGELFSCVAAHLNPDGNIVPIVLSGLPIQGVQGNYEDFWVEEARWVTTQNVDGYPTFYALPTETFNKRCKDPVSAITERICGQNPTDCNLEILSSTDCETINGEWFCKGLPAITTWLQDEVVDILHPLCQLN